MIGDRTVLALIMARGGSKGVPRKNLRAVGGKPLLTWTIEAAQASRFVDRTVLSSEDAEIVAFGRRLRCDVPFVRPLELAADETSAIDVVRHAVGAIDGRYDYLVLLQPTSPLRTGQDIDACVQLCVDGHAPAAVSVVELEENPRWMYWLGADMRLDPVIPGARPTRRQGEPAVYALNGAVFVARVDWLLEHGDFVSPETVGYVMPADRSIDIDTERDLELAHALLTKARDGASGASANAP